MRAAGESHSAVSRASNRPRASRTSSDAEFLEALRKAGASDPPTQKQLESVYRNLELPLLAVVSSFGVEDLNQTISAARAIKARRKS